MKRIIFVGGLQYSGKTTFCRELESINKKQIKHISLDDSFDRLASNKKLLNETIEKYGLRDCINNENVSFGYSDNEVLENIIATCSLMNVVRKDIKPFKKRPSTYLIEGVLSNEISRSILFKAFQLRLDELGIFDDIEKKFVYFDYGVDLSLQRFKSSKRKQIRSMVHSSQSITDTYLDQEIPYSYELRGLQVSVIQNKNDYVRELKKLEKTL